MFIIYLFLDRSRDSILTFLLYYIVIYIKRRGRKGRRERERERETEREREREREREDKRRKISFKSNRLLIRVSDY